MFDGLTKFDVFMTALVAIVTAPAVYVALVIVAGAFAAGR